MKEITMVVLFQKGKTDKDKINTGHDLKRKRKVSEEEENY